MVSFVALAELAGVGLVAGVLSALLGLGGGVFIVPVLTLFFHLPLRAAVGASLVGVIATSAGGAVAALPGKGADVSLALRLELATALGAIGGSLLAGIVSARFLYILFATAVFFSAAYLLYKGRISSHDHEASFSASYHPHNWPLGLSVAGFAGAVAGMLGVGGGFIKVPVMYAAMGVPLGVATATSNFMVGITAAASVFIYYSRGDVHPLVAVPIAVGIFGGAIGGTRLLPHLRVAWIRGGLILLMLGLGVQMLIKGLAS